MTESTSTNTPRNEGIEESASRPRKRASKPLTPSAAAARTRPPQDRRPKATAESSQAASAKPAQRAARQEVDLSVDRDDVTVGFDFRPIPVRLGSGPEHRWEFNPDPDVEAWAQVSDAVEAFRGRDPEDIDMRETAELVERIRAALADMLFDPADRESFIEQKKYGPMALMKLAEAVMKEVTGFPT